MSGYPLDAIREFAALYPDEPNPIAKAEDDALQEPGIGEAIRRVDEKITWLSRSAYAMGGPEGERQELDEERRGLVMAAHGIGTARRGDAGAKSGTLEEDEPSTAAGGRPHKKHPGIALREAARLITNGVENKSEIERKATKKARAAIDDKEIPKGWESGFTARRDVDPLHDAITDKLVVWGPKGLRIRENRHGVFRDVDDFEWLEIPRAE